MFVRLLIAALVFVLTLPAVAHADDAVSYTVTVAEPRQSLVSGKDSVDRICGPYTEGCTVIMGVALAADCVAEAEAWRMRPSVSFIPYVYVIRAVTTRVLRIHQHELKHIGDVERSIETYARGLALSRFPSFEQCREMVNLERNRIGDVTRAFAARSVEMRH